MSKKLTTLLRHGSLPRDDRGAIEFWRIKDYLQDLFVFCHHWSDEKWKSSMAGGGGNKKIFQYCTDSSGATLYLRALQGHSGRSLIDPTLQDNVINRTISSSTFIMSDVQSIYIPSSNSGLIPGGQKLSFLPVDPMDKNHKDPNKIDLEAPRLAQYMHKAWN